MYSKAINAWNRSRLTSAQQPDINPRNDRSGDDAGHIRPHGEGKNDCMLVGGKGAFLSDFGGGGNAGDPGDTD